MNSPGENRVLGVLGGARLDPLLLAAWAHSATYVVAADSGADALLAAKVIPDLVVGDLDSLVAGHGVFPDVRHLPAQDATDCDKLLATLGASGHASITLANVEGDLPDHVLATYHSAAKSKLACRLLMARGFVHVLVGPFDGSFAATSRVSLLPLVVSEGVHLTGVRWPISAARLDPMGFTSISNEAVAPVIQVSLATGAVLLFIESDIQPVWP